MRVQCCLAVSVLALTTCLDLAAQTEKPFPGTLTVENILEYSKAGIPEDIVVARIKGNARAFDLNSDEIQELTRNGISAAVIKVMLDPTYPYTPPSPPALPAASAAPVAPPRTPKKVIDPVAEKVPPNPGVYYSPYPAKVEFQRLEYKTLAATKQGGGFAKLLTGGLKRPVVVGYAIGVSAKVQIETASPVFYIRLADKAGIEEYLLVKFSPGQNRRELDLGSDPAKPVFPATALRQSQSTEVEARLFRVTAGSLDLGEYFFYVLGSAEERKGVLAKGYEFGSVAPIR